MYFYNARWYDPALGRFIQPDTVVPEPRDPREFNCYSYVLNNPIKFSDPSGHTVRTALDLIRTHREDINDIAKKYGLDPILLAGVVFAENRNDRNWVRGQDWSSFFFFGQLGAPEFKNLISPLVKDNASLGITEVSVAVAAMMDDPSLVPSNYGELTWDERATLHETIAHNLSKDQREHILNRLSDPRTSLEYAAKYLRFLGQYRDYKDNYALQLSDYNRGLTDWDTTSEYGRRVDVYRANIELALSPPAGPWPICIGRTGCAKYYDWLRYGDLP